MTKKANLMTTEQRLIRMQMDQFRPTASRMMEVSHQIARAAFRRPQLHRPDKKDDFEFGESENK